MEMENLLKSNSIQPLSPLVNLNMFSELEEKKKNQEKHYFLSDSLDFYPLHCINIKQNLFEYLIPENTCLQLITGKRCFFARLWGKYVERNIIIHL